MKQIIIFLLVIILLLIGYSQYKQYKRFTPPEYEYIKNESIDLNYHDKSLLLDYYKAIEHLNGYVITQWSTNDFDVRNPGDDDEDIQAAVAVYNDKLGLVKYYEDQLVKSKNLKQKGLNNADIMLLEKKGITQDDLEKAESNKNIVALFKNNISQLRLGQRNAFVYELQKLLVKRGFEIPTDGVYAEITQDAVRNFEESKGLFPDGNIDILTLEALLK